MIAEDDHEMVAAEYALGTLDIAEREEVRTLMVANPAFAALVQRWERRLG